MTIEDFARSPDVPSGSSSQGETWLDRAIAAKSTAERDEALRGRASVAADLDEIRYRIRELLDVNENEPPDAQLPISAFDLDPASRRRKTQEARLERERLHREIEEECAQRDRTTSHLREMFWERLLVKPCVLRSIGDPDTTVRNYPIIAAAAARKIKHDVWDRLSADADDEFFYRHSSPFAFSSKRFIKRR